MLRAHCVVGDAEVRCAFPIKVVELPSPLSGALLMVPAAVTPEMLSASATMRSETHGRAQRSLHAAQRKFGFSKIRKHQSHRSVKLSVVIMATRVGS